MLNSFLLLSFCLTLKAAYIVDKQGSQNKLIEVEVNDQNILLVNSTLATFTNEETNKAEKTEKEELFSNPKLGPPDIERTDELQCNLSSNIVQEIASYKPIVDQIINYVLYGDFKGKTYQTLALLTDTFGPRMTGSRQLEDAIDWMLKLSHEESLENIHTEPVQVPFWIRNKESLELIHPLLKELSMLGLGSSVGTPPNGIHAEGLVVRTFEELEARSEQVNGRIVIYNPEWNSYGQMAQFRVHGASRAARLGAVAVLIRSVTPFSMNSPHTGWQHYDDSVHKIPSACITLEDSEMLQRFQDRGEKIELVLKMGAENHLDVISRNTVAEVVGYNLPEEVVVVSGHLDSWDVGVGAMDDGGGSMISWIAPVILQRLGMRARRTIRTVLFTGEEQGLYGGQAYFDRHSKDKDKFQLILESDIGTFDPLGLSISGNNETKCIMKEVLMLMKSLNATELATPMAGGPDIEVWQKAGVPTGSVLNSNHRYFWFHHSAGDTLAVEDESILDKCAALWTAVAFVVGDLNITLPR